MKILLTGAAGYLAGFVIERLRAQHELTLFDRAAPREAFADLPFVRGDISSFDDVNLASAGQEAVVHLVALVRERLGMPHGAYCDVMVKGTWNVAQACAQNGVQRLVNISSVVADGWPQASQTAHRVGDGAQFGEGDLFYCLAKKLGEQICNAYAQAHQLQVTNLRPAVIAGDGANAEPQKPENAPPYWFMHVHPEDVAQAIERALQTQNSGTFNITAGRNDTLWDWRDAQQKLGYAPEFNWPEIEK